MTTTTTNLTEAGRRLSAASLAKIDAALSALKTLRGDDAAAAVDELKDLLNGDDTGDNLQERDFSAEMRKEMADKGWALADGSFPIETKADLRNAIAAIGRASNRAMVMQHIMKRARALDAMAMVPEDWNATTKVQEADGTAKMDMMRRMMMDGRTDAEIVDRMVEMGMPEEEARSNLKAMKDAGQQGQMREGVHFIEAVKGSDGREWDVLLIEAGMSRNPPPKNYYYPAEALKAATPLIEGAAAYEDHATDEDMRRRKGRRVREKVGVFRSAEFGRYNVRGRLVEGLKARFKVLAPWLRETMLEAEQAGELDFVQFSIDADGIVKQKELNGQKVPFVERIERVNSIDVVDRAAAGGTVIRLAEAKSASGEGDDMDEQAIATMVEQKLNAIMEPLVMRVREQMQEALAAQTTTATDVIKEVTELKESLRRERGQVRLTEALAAAPISDLSKTRLRKLWEETLSRRDIQDDELQATLKEAQDYEAALAQQFANPRGVGTARSGASLGLVPHEKYVLGLQGLFAGEDQQGVPQFRTLKEAYARWVGQDYLDVDPLEMYYAFGARYDSGVHHRKLQESLTTASWGEIFADNLYMMMIRAYQANPMYNQWRAVVSDIENAPDFQTRHWARIGGYADLATVAEQGTYPTLTSPTDEEVTYAIAKRGGLDDVTMEMMSYERGTQKLRSIPIAMSRSAVRTLYKFVMNLITTDNPSMDYDSTTLYHSDHANTGTTALSLNGLDTTQRAMRDQTAYNESAEILGPRNAIKYLVVPNELEMRAKRIVDPSDSYYIQMLDDTAAAGSGATGIDPQAFKGKGIVVLVYDVLTDANNWFAVADPKQVPTVVMGFWRGQQEPELFVQDNPLVGSAFTSDKIVYKIRHVYGGDVLDHRSMYRQDVT